MAIAALLSGILAIRVVNRIGQKFGCHRIDKEALALGGLGENVRAVFAATGFDSIIAIERDAAAAVAAVR